MHDDIPVPIPDPDGFDEDVWQERIAEQVSRRQRLRAVAATGLVGSDVEEVFDRLTQLASDLFGVPCAFVTLVDDTRSFWKSCLGVDAIDAAGRQNLVGESFCQYVVATGAPLLIDDARLDPRTKRNPSIASMGVVAWAGAPVLSAEGEVLGTFCVVDGVPRRWTAADEGRLEIFAGAAASEIRLRTALREAQQVSRRSELLAALGHELSAADGAEAVAETLAAAGHRVFGALFVTVALIDDDRRLRGVPAPHLPTAVTDRYRTIEVSDRTPAGTAVVEGRMVTASTFAEYGERWPAVAEDAAAIGIVAVCAVPLRRSDGTVMGALSVGWADEQSFEPGVLGVVHTMKQMCADALERAQLSDSRRTLIRHLQRELLPGLPALADLDAAVRYSPAIDDFGFGGDWYDVFSLSPTVTAVIVSDVSGHGIAAAATMAQLKGTFNWLVRSQRVDLDEVFDVAARWHGEGPESFIATVAVHLIDTEADTITFVSAGHPPAIVVRPDGVRELLRGGRRSVFGMRAPHVDAARAAFPKGSVLLAYTDGLVERRRMSIDHGISALVELVAAHSNASAEALAQMISEWMPPSPADDIAFAIVRRVR